MRNPTTQDALEVEVSVNVLDAAGLILSTDTNSISGIPAGVTYYDGGSTVVNGGERVAKLETLIAVGSSDNGHLALPRVSNVRATDEGYGFVTARGQVENPFTKPLSSFARIGIIAFDRAGRVVSGTYTYLDADLPPGRSAAFTTGLDGVASGGEVASVKASMENSVGP